MPRWIIPLAVFVVTVAAVPFVLIARARVTTTETPRIHLIQDMDHRLGYRGQVENTLFADRRAMRPAVPGAVARGELEEDEHYYRGRVERDGRLTWAERFPEQLELDMDLVRRGQERYEIFCAVCHGYSGGGDGPTQERIRLRQEQGAEGFERWAAPVSLLTERARGLPAGEVYNVIANGMNNMPPYRAQIPVSDRWAIVAYVQALQRSQPQPPE